MKVQRNSTKGIATEATVIEYDAAVQAANSYYLKYIHNNRVEIKDPNKEVFKAGFAMMLTSLASHAFTHQIEDEFTPLIRQAIINLEVKGNVAGVDM